VIDFVAVLFGYAISGERTLEAFPSSATDSLQYPVAKRKSFLSFMSSRRSNDSEVPEHVPDTR
jgi:hypothetical protein